MAELASGRNNYGQVLGILMVNTSFTRIPGDIGNASTFKFPVRYKVIENATPALVVEKAIKTLLPQFIEAAKELETEGVRAITTSCGFLALLQKEMADALHIPIFTSSLLQVPLAYRMMPASKKVGILTANSKALTKDHLRSVGITDDIPVAIAGLEDREEFAEAIGGNLKRPLEPHKIQAGIVSVCNELKKKEDIGAIVFECTNLPPYSYGVQKSTGLPVFDIITLCNYIHDVVLRKEFEGFL
ncbi:MAG: aspartate/glutamate racemase family protein [Candidatus Thorarchaeota archaeon]|nr:aspartate/glutamate racemase family protein [Candidatus Thorarchaeota archaeon]